MSKYIARIEISTPTTIWNRCIFTDNEINNDELYFYYNELLGIENATIKVETEEVPESFNISLIPFNDSAPSAYPAHDLETLPEHIDRRNKYYEYIRQLCEMERTRASLQSFATIPTIKPTIPNMRDKDKYYFKSNNRYKKTWVSELLNSLNPEMEYEDNILAVATDDITIPVIGWIFTPSAVEIRKEKGSRIIFNKEIGEKWEKLLGTDLYPDMICCRRITTHAWAFQNDKSNALVKSIIDWYITSQDAEVSINGITTFIPKCEVDISNIVNTFRRIKVSERHLTENASDATSQIYKLLSMVEDRLLTIDAEAIDMETFNKYITYLFRNSGIPQELYTNETRLISIIERWVRSGMGFRACVEPLVNSWVNIWNTIMRDQAVTNTRVKVFLTTIDCWDPIISATFTNQEKSIIVQEWIWAYIDTQLVISPKSKVKSVILHDQVRKWCYQYLPQHVFMTQIVPGRMGPIFTLRGFPSKKGKEGRFTHGVHFKNFIEAEDDGTTGIVEMDEEDEPYSMNSVQYSETTQKDGEKTAKRRTVTQKVIAETDGNRLEHFFTAVTHEVHLGAI